MLKNNNLKICRKLIRRELKFHKGQSFLLILAVTLVCMLYTFSFLLGNLVHDGFIYSYKAMYGSESHIIYYDLSSAQAAALKGHMALKDTAVLSPVGMLSDEMLENRNVRLAEVSEKWALATDSMPLYGRMPTEKDEIALDEITLNSLVIPHEIGAEVSVKWLPEGSSRERISTFRLCGWWKSNTGETDSCAWISRKAAEELRGDAGEREHLMLGAVLYLPGDLEKQAENILSDLGLQDIVYTTNLAYNKARQEYAQEKAAEFYQMNLIVVLCGVIMLSNILGLSIRQNIRFYGRVKSLGMTPRQIRRLAMERALMLCLPGLLPGWLLGFSLCALVAPVVVVGMDENPLFAFFQIWPFALSALFTSMTVLAACALPMRLVAGKTPAEAMRVVARKTSAEAIRVVTKKTPAKAMQFMEKKITNGTMHYVEKAGNRHGKRKKRRSTDIRLMALSGLFLYKKQSVLAAFSLLLSLVILCFVWSKGVSYDEEKYLEGMALCDYLISDASAVSSVQRYNPNSRSITPQMIETLSAHPAVTDIGIACTVEVPMYADESGRAPVVASFEGKDENGIALKEYMADDPDWMAGYEKMRESGEYTGIVTGVNGLMLKNTMARNILIEGDFSQKAFDTGNYVIAAGSNSIELKTTPPAGSKVIICGREFEIMASVPYESSLISGADSRQAQFNVTYYMPVSVFEELFPEHGIRNAAVNIDHVMQEEFEEFLAAILEDTGCDVTSISDYQEYFRNAVFHQVIIPLFVGSVMLFIGILNFTNALMTGMLVRKKEFAVYESLAMTRGQLKKILLWEGIFSYTGILILLIPGTSIAAWIRGKWWLAHTNTWCVTWRFSLMPLWISIPVLFVLALAVPLYFLKTVTKESVTERLRVVE